MNYKISLITLVFIGLIGCTNRGHNQKQTENSDGAEPGVGQKQEAEIATVKSNNKGLSLYCYTYMDDIIEGQLSRKYYGQEVKLDSETNEATFRLPICDGTKQKTFKVKALYPDDFALRRVLYLEYIQTYLDGSTEYKKIEGHRSGVSYLAADYENDTAFYTVVCVLDAY